MRQCPKRSKWVVRILHGFKIQKREFPVKETLQMYTYQGSPNMEAEGIWQTRGRGEKALLEKKLVWVYAWDPTEAKAQKGRSETCLGSG
jgi:hypothetical protein